MPSAWARYRCSMVPHPGQSAECRFDWGDVMMRRRSVVIPMCLLVAAVGCSKPTSPAAPPNSADAVRTGLFYGVQGLSYETPTLSGVTDVRGEFRYKPGEMVTFSVGRLVLGSAAGGERLTSAHLVLGANGDIKKLKVPRVTNLERLLESLDDNGNVEDGIAITSRVGDIVTHYRNAIRFAQSESTFGSDPQVAALLGE